MLNAGQNWLFVLRDLEIWRMTLKINRTPFLFYVNLWASFHRIQIWVTVRKRSIRVKIGDFWPRDLEIWRMTLINNRGTLPYHTKHFASFQSHRWIQTGVTVRKRPIEVEIGDFLSLWPSNLIDDLENNRAPLLCYFKLFASFHSYFRIQTGVTARKHPLCKNRRFVLSEWPWNLTDDHEKQ